MKEASVSPLIVLETLFLFSERRIPLVPPIFNKDFIIPELGCLSEVYNADISPEKAFFCSLLAEIITLASCLDFLSSSLLRYSSIRKLMIGICSL
jgi:hypothetical protein